jgi:hypothetical protein
MCGEREVNEEGVKNKRPQGCSIERRMRCDSDSVEQQQHIIELSKRRDA